MIRKKIMITILLISAINLTAQNTINQNGLQSTVINNIAANGMQAKRFEIAKLMYNSYHWQEGSIVIIELYNVYFGSGHVKYILELGYGQGTGSTNPSLKLTEINGINQNAKIVLGVPITTSISYGGYPNKTISIFADIRYYSLYRVKITHLKNKVTNLTNPGEIIINEVPTSINISDFQPILEKTIGWNISSSNINYLNGSVGIGTNSPDSKLSVNGKIHAKEVKVDLVGWPDYVFTPEYQLPTLKEVEKHINQKGHLKDIPSAKDVAENGVLLGEMNKNLLLKIEELTLYAIQQQKEINLLKKENKKINELESKIQAILLKIK